MLSLPSASHVRFICLRSGSNIHISACRRNASSRPTTVIVLGLTMLMLWASTTTYVVTCILYYRYDILNSFLTAGDGLWTFGHGIFLDFRPPPDLLEDYTSLQSCTSTAALTVNVSLIPTPLSPQNLLISLSYRLCSGTPLYVGGPASSGIKTVS